MAETTTRVLEPYRRELTGHCRRILRSNLEAEDAAQETIVRAWQSLDGFEGRSTLRWWLHRIATNVCVDMQRQPQRRAQPAADPEPPPAAADPAERAAARDAVRLAFTAALLHLPPRQRAMLILHEVLQWRAAEIAELLDTSEAAVNSGLQRARARLAARRHDDRVRRLGTEQKALLSRYTGSLERRDMGALVSLLRNDATR